MKYLGLVSATVSALAASQAGAQVMADFVSPDGVCDSVEYEELAQFPVSGNSVTVRLQAVKSGSLAASPETPAAIPPFTPVKCFASSGDQILILSEEGGQNFCGWVPRDALLRGASDADDADLNGGATNVFQSNAGLVCPTLRPMSVTEYCQKIEALGDFEPLCDDVRTADGDFKPNPIETKFLTWNANLGEDVDRTIVPLFSAPDPAAKLEEDLSIFSIMRVWDIADAGGEIFALVGPNQKSVVGWMPISAGTVWFSKLTAFFARANDAPILTAEPGTSGAEKLAERPPNLGEMLDGSGDFEKYPVLIDRRDVSPDLGLQQDPHLKLAFIGADCGQGQLCADTSGERLTERIQLLEAVDILFVIDATKSMQDYFAIVADAVNEITGERASTTTRFGAIMYGDYLRRGAQGLDAPMQIRSAIELTEIFNGDEFDELPDEELFIDDALVDKPEAAFAAIYQAIQGADWRGEGARFVIHLADHGDRGSPGARLVDLMKANQIFYMPIAVRGEFLPQFNQDFVDQSQSLVDRLKLGDAALGIPTQVTFEGGVAQSNDAAARNILKSLRAATELQEVITSDVTNELLGRDVASRADSNRYPAGFAQLTEAARTLYGIDTEGLAGSIEQRTLAAPGYVAVAPDGQSTDWEFQVALAPRDLGRLIRDFDLLCKSMNDSTAQSDLSGALRSVIETLTGDVLSTDNARFYSYFDNRGEIPLVTQTILGNGILDLGRDLTSFSDAAAARVETYRREACRTSKLLRLMDSDRLVERPFESNPNGQGDLIWDDASQTYNDLKSRPFTWTQIGLYDVQTVYLPLKYLPRPYAEQ